jgi:hypothetical protein
VIDADPAAFGANPPEAVTTPRRRRRAVASTLVAAAVVVVLVIAVVWPGHERAPAVATTTTVEVTVAASLPSGRPAALSVSDLELSLSVQPAEVPSGSIVTMRLEGDLTIVPTRVAAVAWVDHLTSTGWRTVYWMARSSDFVQEVRPVSDDHPEPGPDAVMIPAAESMEFFADGIVPGSYRVCRFVPLRPDPVSNLPTDPVYLCAPLVVAS